MKLKDKIIKFSVVFLLASVAISTSLKGMDGAVTDPNLQSGFSCFAPKYYLPSESISSIIFNRPTADPLGYLFQIIFILFLISPPVIAFLLFLIWKELRERNKMK